MSRREDIDNAIWSDPDFEALSLAATALYLWSFTNPRCGMAGIYKVSRRAMTESKVQDDDLDAAVAELAEARFLFYEGGVLFVRARVKHMRQRTEQIAKSIRTDLAKLAADHPVRAMWVTENARAPWLVKFLGDAWEASAVPDGEAHASLGRGSTEGRAVGSLEQFPRGSSKGRSTLHGNGKGKGTGTGSQGRGAGRGKRAEFERFAAENFPDHSADEVILIARQIAEDGREPSVAEIRSELGAAA